MASQEIPRGTQRFITVHTSVHYFYPDSDEFRPHPFDFFKALFNIIPSSSGCTQQANSLMFIIPNALCISWFGAWSRESLLRACRLWEKLWSVIGTHFIINTYSAFQCGKFSLCIHVRTCTCVKRSYFSCWNLWVCICVHFIEMWPNMCPSRQFQKIISKLLNCAVRVSLFCGRKFPVSCNTVRLDVYFSHAYSFLRLQLPDSWNSKFPVTLYDNFFPRRMRSLSILHVLQHRKVARHRLLAKHAPWKRFLRLLCVISGTYSLELQYNW